MHLQQALLTHLRRLPGLHGEHDHVDERLRVAGVLLQRLGERTLRLLELALLQKRRGLAVQQQRRRAELVDQLLIDVVSVLDLVAALLKERVERGKAHV